MVAVLPKNRETTNKIRQMKPGDEGWMVPWGMYVNSKGECYLNSEYTISRSPDGTVQMHIRRDKDGKYHVDVTRCNDTWDRGEPCYVGDFTPIPVESIKG